MWETADDLQTLEFSLNQVVQFICGSVSSLPCCTQYLIAHWSQDVDQDLADDVRPLFVV